MSMLFSFLKDMYWEVRAGRTIDVRPLVAYLRGATITHGGVKIRIYRELSYQIVQSILKNDYEESERRLIEGALRPGDVVFELGAGLGYVAAACAKIVGSDRVHSYEANPRLEPLIRQTFALNDVSPRLTIGLCGSERGKKNFYISRDFWASSTIRSADTTEELEVDAIALTEELERTAPTVFIADIEGGEYELFRDFAFPTCRLIMLEVHPKILGAEKADFVHQRIRDMGFAPRGQIADSFLYERQPA